MELSALSQACEMTSAFKPKARLGWLKCEVLVDFQPIAVGA
tara:strand:+ start:227 stop:349 length:123 start_codon:yes stop_codon:yes gene_type:complete